MAACRKVRSIVAEKPRPSRISEDRPGIFDVSEIRLQGEEDESVPVYDTCSTVRRKIAAFLRIQSVTQRAFLDAISAASGDNRTLQGGQLKRFLAMKGPLAGNTSGIYYLAYVFFEKARIRDNKPKSLDRRQIEMLHPNGMSTTEIRNRAWAPEGMRARVNKYGVIQIC